MAAQLAGRATASDIAAGVALGQAAIFMARADSDATGNAAPVGRAGRRPTAPVRPPARPLKPDRRHLHRGRQFQRGARGPRTGQGQHGAPSPRSFIALPNFPAYQSGHSVFPGAAAAVLSYLLPANAAYFAAQRDQAALSRLDAGLHFRSDIEGGKGRGLRVGGYTIRFAQGERRGRRAIVFRSAEAGKVSTIFR